MRAIQITHGQKTLIRKVIIAFGEMLSIAAKKKLLQLYHLLRKKVIVMKRIICGKQGTDLLPKVVLRFPRYFFVKICQNLSRKYICDYN